LRVPLIMVPDNGIGEINITPNIRTECMIIFYAL
jgi:hypothetical protein